MAGPTLPPRPPYRWVDPPPVDGGEVRRLERELGLPPVACRLLVRRGYGAPEDARRFLRPSFSHLHPPERLPDMATAVERITAALAGDEAILVHGDYDADGVCAAALLVRGLEGLGARVEGYVPHRLRDGYDLGPAGLERAREMGAGLVVTADCGISAVKAVEEARDAGVDVVVTDHHRPPPRLPDATALVNPGLEGSGYPFSGLSGVGVAYKLLVALYRAAELDPAALNRHLDLVALGTVADVVPLVDENRVLVRAGLKALEMTEKPGLRALMRRVGATDRVTAGEVGYLLGPRLNAAGRVGEARTGLRLLLTEDPDEAASLAERLEDRNRQRREEDGRVQREAEERLAREFDPERDRAVVLWGEDWHPGVVGIAASRLVERIHRPVILVSLQGETGRGSGRSVAGFHIHEALAECASLLERYGGHRMAAGLELRRERLESFAERFREVARRELDDADLAPELRLDLEVPLHRADDELLGWLDRFAPFGADNPRPLLKTTGVAFEGATAVGREGSHLKGVLSGPEGTRLEAIGFGMGERLPEVEDGGRWDVAYRLQENRYRGRRRLQARLEDFRPAT